MLLILYSIVSHFERKGDMKDSPLMDWMFLHSWLLHNFKAQSVFPLISTIESRCTPLGKIRFPIEQGTHSELYTAFSRAF